MPVYAAVLITGFALLIGAHRLSSDGRRWMALACVVVLTGFAGLRGYVGTDTYAYHLMFDNNSNEDLSFILRTVEPIFALLIKFVAWLSGNSFAFVAAISVIQGILLSRLVSTSRSPLDFLMIYLAIFYLNLHFNVIRAGTSLLLLLLANRVPRQSPHQGRFYLLGAAAVCAHYSALIAVLPMAVLRQKSVQAKLLTVTIAVVLAALLYLYLVGSDGVIGKYVSYSDILTPDVSESVSLSFILGLPLYLMLFVSTVNKRNAIPLALFFGIWVVVRWLTSIYSLAGRVEAVINSLLLFSVIEFTLVGWRHRLRKVALIGLATMWVVGSLLGLEREDEIMFNLGVSDDIYLASPFIPYKFIWDDI